MLHSWLRGQMLPKASTSLQRETACAALPQHTLSAFADRFPVIAPYGPLSAHCALRRCAKVAR
jgi:hypothetical protein